MDVRLVMFKANGQRREFRLQGETVRLGRGPDCHLQIPLATVSRRHCQILFEEHSLKVRDLGSSNGTFVNDKRIQESPLAAGDRLVIGPVIFTVTIDGQPAEIKPVRTVIVEHAVEPVHHAEGSGTMDVDVDAALAQPVPDLQSTTPKS